MREEYPSLYEVNTRHLLSERSAALGRPATLDDLESAWVDRVAGLGFDLVWMLGVWTIGPAGRAVSRSQEGWRRDYLTALPDVTEGDIVGSPFAVTGYTVHPDFGGEPALARLRARLKRRGIGLILDFVPNHVGLDHPWLDEHPEYLIRGTDADLHDQPGNFVSLRSRGEPAVFAHGRDPYFPGWPDTVQLDYRSEGLRSAMIETLKAIADRCDGVRCDMAMLVLPEVFSRTWDASPPPDAPAPPGESFWREAIAGVKAGHPSFLFMAEAYWGLEWSLLGEGFDYTYDKTLYDRLREADPRSIRGHLHADPDFQARSVRFLENHDEPRAAEVFPPDQHRAAAVLTFLVPGLRFVHEGQVEGRARRASIHLARRSEEPVDAGLSAFYHDLLAVVFRPVLRSGRFDLVGCNPAWEGNPTWEQFLAFRWEAPGWSPLLVVVNYGPIWGQCYARLSLDGLPKLSLRLVDLLGVAQYDRDGADLAARGLYLDLPPWGYHVFEVRSS